ncbi:MAG: HD domain-containing phosphohydrolase [Deltaproteobacteria bacterium]
MLPNNKLLKLVKVISSGTNFEETLEFVFHSFQEHIPYNRIGIGLIDKLSDTVYCQAVHSDNSTVLKSGFTSFSKDTTVMEVVASGKPRIIDDLREYIKIRPHSKTTKLLLEENVLSSITLPLYVNDSPIGVVFFSSYLPNVYKKEHIEFLEQIATFLAISIEKNILINDLILVSITGLAKLVESKDSETGFHIERIKNYSETIARQLAKNEAYRDILNDHYIQEISDFAPIHDIGKVGIADGILLKPARLSPEEFEVMKKHTIIGAEVLRKSGSNMAKKDKHYFSTAIDIAIGHHEKVNGKGYPFGLSGEQIPISAKIVAVADVFDALTSKRVYKEPVALKASYDIIASEVGASFDPDVVNAFLKCEKQITNIYSQFKEDSHLFF